MELRNALSENNLPDKIRTMFPQDDLKALDDLAKEQNAPGWWKQEDDGPGECQGVCRIHRKWEETLGKEISEWRRERARFHHEIKEGKVPSGMGGLSFWRLEELDAERRLLLRWSLHSRKYGRRREDGTRPAIFVKSRARGIISGKQNVEWVDTDQRLLEHINNFKEDRRKVGANMIVMAALGYEFHDDRKGKKKDEAKWGQLRDECAHLPKPERARCDLILFENLGGYGFRKDRPRRENSKLMKWAHRSIPKEVMMQGQLFGLRVYDVLAQYSSRVYARNLSPGIRCHLVREVDLEPGSYYHAKWKEEINDTENSPSISAPTCPR
jgi:hypothetical protein